VNGYRFLLKVETMYKTSKDFDKNPADWKPRKNTRYYKKHKFLFIKADGHDIGNAIQATPDEDVLVFALLPDMGGCFTGIPADSTLEAIHVAWKETMDRLLSENKC